MWGWKISSLLYARAGGKVSEEFDRALIDRLGSRVKNARVADCGCGPGVTAQRMVDAGAERVVAIDVTEGMLRQVPDDPRIVKVQANIEPGILPSLGEEVLPDGADLVLFKRSLYQRGEDAVRILRDAWELVRPRGSLVVALPHRNILQYALGHPPRIRSFTFYHLFNRAISIAADKLRIHSYRTSNLSELGTLFRRAIPEVEPQHLLDYGLPFAVVSATRPDRHGDGTV